MYIKEDYSYINETSKSLLSKGFAKLDIHSLNFDRYYTEEEQQKNRDKANSMTRKQWDEHCDKVAQSYAILFDEILTKFEEKYNIHQTTPETSTMEHYRSNWDLYFWSNKGWNQKSVATCFSLSFNSSRNADDNMKLLNEIIPFVESLDYKNVGCRIQYCVQLNGADIDEEALRIVKNLEDQFVEFWGYTGKIKVIKEENGHMEYGFFKKGAKKKYSPISDAEIVALYSDKQGGNNNENK